MKQEMLFENETANACALLPAGPLDVDLNVRALSWKPPYSELMLPPFDKIETRTWNTDYRGLVLICASKQPYTEMQLIGISGEVQTQRIFNSLNSRRVAERTGQAIGIGYLVDCRLMTPEDSDKCYVAYKAPWWEQRKNKKTGEVYSVLKKLYVHIYKNVQPIECIEWEGSQGWRRLPSDVKAKIVVQRTCR